MRAQRSVPPATRSGSRYSADGRVASVAVSELLAAHDAQVRARIPNPLPRGTTVERDGPVVRFLKPLDSDRQGFVCYPNLDGLTGSEIDELIARQVQVFS